MRVNAAGLVPPHDAVQNSGMARLRRFIAHVTLSRSLSDRAAKFGIDFVEESRATGFIDIECAIQWQAATLAAFPRSHRGHHRETIVHLFTNDHRLFLSRV